MFMCTSRFEVQEEQHAMLREYLSNHEIQLANEDKATPHDNFDPISEDEEECSDSLSFANQRVPDGSINVHWAKAGKVWHLSQKMMGPTFLYLTFRCVYQIGLGRSPDFSKVMRLVEHSYIARYSLKTKCSFCIYP